MRYEILGDAGEVLNTIIANLEFMEEHYQNKYRAVPEVALPPQVPEFVPMLNAELVLISAGYWDDVQDFISKRGPYALAFLRRAQTMRRDNVLVNAWAAARGVTDAQLDSLFFAAGDLKVDEFHG